MTKQKLCKSVDEAIEKTYGDKKFCRLYVLLNQRGDAEVHGAGAITEVESNFIRRHDNIANLVSSDD